jgi:hypothetical protein
MFAASRRCGFVLVVIFFVSSFGIRLCLCIFLHSLLEILRNFGSQ